MILNIIKISIIFHWLEAYLRSGNFFREMTMRIILFYPLFINSCQLNQIQWLVGWCVLCGASTLSHDIYPHALSYSAGFSIIISSSIFWRRRRGEVALRGWRWWCRAVAAPFCLWNWCWSWSWSWRWMQLSALQWMELAQVLYDAGEQKLNNKK